LSCGQVYPEHDAIPDALCLCFHVCSRNDMPGRDERPMMNLRRDEVAAFAAALALHSLVLCGMWHYRASPPPEVTTVSISDINPAAPAKVAEPAALKPAPAGRETPKPLAPAVPKVLTGATPVSIPAEPVAPPAPATASASPRTANGAPPGEAAPQTALRKEELSVSCTERTPPVYPRLSARLGEQGKAVLLVELDELGRVTSVGVTTTSGFTRLDEAAVAAVKTWRCTPARRNGVAVRSVAAQPFNFTLKGR
jgi:periplasmic protein TonB